MTVSEYHRQYYSKNKTRLQEYQRDYQKRYYAKNKEYFQRWRKNNKLKVIEYHKHYREKKKKYMEAYLKGHKSEYQNYQKAYRAKRRQFDTNFKISESLRNRLNKALKHQSKTGSAVRDLGCSVEDFKTYITSKFLPEMTWDNYGEWHLDHIVPLSKFDLTNKEQLRIALNYTNYQPLWSLDNIIKGNTHVLNFKEGIF